MNNPVRVQRACGPVWLGLHRGGGAAVAVTSGITCAVGKTQGIRSHRFLELLSHCEESRLQFGGAAGDLAVVSAVLDCKTVAVRRSEEIKAKLF